MVWRGRQGCRESNGCRESHGLQGAAWFVGGRMFCGRHMFCCAAPALRCYAGLCCDTDWGVVLRLVVCRRYVGRAESMLDVGVLVWGIVCGWLQ